MRKLEDRDGLKVLHFQEVPISAYSYRRGSADFAISGATNEGETKMVIDFTATCDEGVNASASVIQP